MDRAFGEQRNSITSTISQASGVARTLGMGVAVVVALLLGVVVAKYARGGETTSEPVTANR